MRRILNRNGMKRFWNVFLAGIVLACVSVGCSKKADDAKALDGLIAQYEEACGACDVQRAMLLADQLDRSQLTPEQSVRMIKASNLGAQIASDSFKKVANSMPYNYWDVTLDRYEELVTEYAEILKQKEAGKNVKDKMHRQEDKIENLADKLDDAKLTKKQQTRFKKLKDWYNDIED